MGDDLDDLAKIAEHDKMHANKTKKKKLDNLRKAGQVTNDVKLRKAFREKNLAGGKYEMIGSDDEEIKQEADFVESEPELSSSSSEEDSGDELVRTAEDRERILLKLQEAELGIKSESKV